jgi:hypothetical protein
MKSLPELQNVGRYWTHAGQADRKLVERVYALMREPRSLYEAVQLCMPKNSVGRGEMQRDLPQAR